MRVLPHASMLSKRAGRQACKVVSPVRAGGASGDLSLQERARSYSCIKKRGDRSPSLECAEGHTIMRHGGPQNG